MNTLHRRRIIVPLGSSDPRDPLREETFELILFYKDEKLKSHAVKHLTNLGESETAWKSLSFEERAIVTDTIRRLQDLGCPHFSVPTSVPPCEYGVSSCRFYPRCGEITAELEQVYLRAVTEVITQSIERPRWASFFSDRDGNPSLVFMGDRPVVAKASLMEDNVYNIITCYSSVGQGFQEMRDLQLEMIKNEARGHTIIYHDEAAWGLAGDETDEDIEQENGENDPVGKSHKRKNKSGRYRGGGAHWRRFLNERE